MDTKNFIALEEISKDIKIDIIFSVPRAGSTIFERALTEGYDHQSHEPFFGSSFDEGCGRILSHIHPETKSIVIKAMGRTLEDEDLNKIISICDNVIICTRDPNLTFSSAHKIKNLSQHFEEESQIIENVIQRSGWDTLDRAYSIAEQSDKNVSIIDFTTLCVNPKDNMELLCQRLGVDYKNEMIKGFPKTKNLDNWQYNEKVKALLVAGHPLGEDVNGPKDPWMKNARSAVEFQRPKEWEDPELHQKLRKNVDNEVWPIYRKIQNSNNVVLAGKLDDYKDYINPLIIKEKKWESRVGDKTGRFIE